MKVAIRRKDSRGLPRRVHSLAVARTAIEPQRVAVVAILHRNELAAELEDVPNAVPAHFDRLAVRGAAVATEAVAVVADLVILLLRRPIGIVRDSVGSQGHQDSVSAARLLQS